MNVWILNHYAGSPADQATRTYDLSKKLVERGHDVTIFAAGFSHYSFKEEHIRGEEKYREEQWYGVRFIWLRTLPYRSNNWRRIINMMNYSWRAFWLGTKFQEKPDVIIGVSVHPLAALTGWCLSRIKRSSFFVELTDLWPEVLIDFGMLSPRNPLTYVLRALERFLYSKAEKIITLWPRTGEYLARFNVPEEKLIWLPHLADVARYTALDLYDGQIRDRFSIMYLGTFNESTGLGVVPKAAKLLQDRGLSQVHFILVGGSTGKNALVESCEILGLKNVEFRELVPKNEIGRVMGEADAFLATLKNVPLLRYGISLNKLCDYFASGRPTILAGMPGYNPVEEANAGISIPGEDAVALADGVQMLMSISAAERVQMGQNGRNYLSRVHDINILSSRLESALLAKASVSSAKA